MPRYFIRIPSKPDVNKGARNAEFYKHSEKIAIILTKTV
jgi:hypothetical protein